jgi:hypothetical protein
MKSLLLAIPLFAALVACDTEDATTAVVANDYPAAADGGTSDAVVVYRAWWVTTLFASSVSPGASSATERTVPGEDHAYALLAPGWDPSSTTPPTRLVPVRSATKLTVDRGATLNVVVNPVTFVGNCANGTPLSQDDADFITTRIFPGPFAGHHYDAATCTLSP